MYSEIPLLRPPKFKTNSPLKSIFKKFQSFFRCVFCTQCLLERDHLWDCSKVVLKTTFEQSKRWSYYRKYTLFLGAFFEYLHLLLFCLSVLFLLYQYQAEPKWSMLNWNYHTKPDGKWPVWSRKSFSCATVRWHTPVAERQHSYLNNAQNSTWLCMLQSSQIHKSTFP